MSVRGAEDFEGFVYLDYHKMPAAWNIVRGVYSSPDMLSDNEQSSVLSLFMGDMLIENNEKRFASECCLDIVRQVFYPENVSRLRGVFVFDEIESVAQIWSNNLWGKKHFQDEYLVDVGVATQRSSRVDSNWICEIMDAEGALTEDWYKCAHRYWNGDAHPEKQPVWERIVSGYLTIWGTDAKYKALSEIQSFYPNSLNVLRDSVHFGLAGSQEGLCVPIWWNDNGTIRIEYCLRWGEARKPEFIQRITNFLEDNPQCICTIGNDGQDSLPDFSGLNGTFNVEQYEELIRLTRMRCLSEMAQNSSC